MAVGKGSIQRAAAAGGQKKTADKSRAEQNTAVLEQIPVESVRKIPGIEKRPDQNTAEGLKKSVQKYGLLEPVIVCRKDAEDFLLLSGYRRLEAAASLKIEFIPAVVYPEMEEISARAYYDQLHKQEPFDFQQAKFQVISSINTSLPDHLL